MSDPKYIQALVMASDDLEQAGLFELSAKIDRAVALLTGETTVADESFNRAVTQEFDMLKQRLANVSSTPEYCYRAALVTEAQSNVAEVRQFINQLEYSMLHATDKQDLATDCALAKALSRIAREWS
jgi:hypothetical protein